jgi:molecular chaperone DnaK
VLTPLVERNTTIPTTRKKTFSTAADMQTAVTVMVYQGERKMAHNNRLLGQFTLEGLPPAPRGVPQIEVSFDLDANGILNVSAKDLGTGKEASVRIEQSAGLSENEIDRMRKDAESHADDDRKEFELAEARNQGEHLCYQIEKLMQEHADKLQEADKAPLRQAIEKVREKAKTTDTDEIKSAVAELEQAQQAFSKSLYQRSQSAGATSDNGDGAAQSSSDDDAIDAEFEVKKD